MRILALLTVLLSLSWASSAQEGGHHGGPQVSYIGFNTLKADHKAHRVEAFKNYIATIKPIMERYGHTLDVYKVDHNSDPDHPVDFITFGTAPSQQAFQAFFGDAEFQHAFPTLVENIGGHFVTFVDSVVVPEKRHGGYTMLSLDWLKDMDDGARHAFGEMDHKLASIGVHKGADRTHKATGVMASTGLTDDLAPAEAPSVVALWHMTDPHDFLEDSEVSAINRKLAEHSASYRSFWISLAE